MVTSDPYEDGTQETRQDFTDIASRVHTLRHLSRQVGHDV